MEPGTGSGEGRQRVVIEGVTPEIDCGEFAIKRTVGEKVVVEADVFSDGHDRLSCVLQYRRILPGVDDGSEASHEVHMRPLGNDRWQAEFGVTELGEYRYTIVGWVDHFKTWSQDLAKRVDAGQDVAVDLLIGAELVEDAARHLPSVEEGRAVEPGSGAVTPVDRVVGQLSAAAAMLRRGGADAITQGLSRGLADLMAAHAPRTFATRYGHELPVTVDRVRARFGAWYELFPRSASPDPERNGTLRDVEARLPYIAEMGFDVLYLPPIHPIGSSFRKGRNNQVEAGPGEPGSPWAIGSPEGGHKSLHPDLGTLDDFRRLVAAAGRHGIDVALDIAFQTSPDHPFAREHPEWYRRRPDQTIQYAENPPKKYQDIYPFDFEGPDWRGLWDELRGVIEFWIDGGVHIFRVDNPHTKPFAFWQWLIAETKRDHPEVIFLAEAFTRPKVMQHLAKLGFSQSYTYFTWRNTCQEIADYFTELTQTEVREFYRPNLWPNTPDILNEYLQLGGRPAFAIRLVLAATLGASYGIYGPAFELAENTPIEPGKEEYANSEKYEVRHWDLDRPDSLRPLITQVNAIRRANPALQSDWSLRFHPADDDHLICYSKQTASLDNIIVVVANLDPHHAHAGEVELPLEAFGIDARQPYQMHDLLGDSRYFWSGSRNYVQLDPKVQPALIFRVRRRLRRENDFDYYM